LPSLLVFSLLSQNFAQAMMLTLPFTLATYMVRDWLSDAAAATTSSDATATAAVGEQLTALAATGPATTTAVVVDERRVGELTGLLTAVYSLSQALTSIPFGRWSDAHGRRPVLLLSAAVSSLSIAAFGLSPGLGCAMAARAVGGALNAFIGAWKTALAEATGGDEHEQARVMALMGLAWGVGCVLGPATGGALARWPCGDGGCDGGGFPASLFAARPYALPCLVVSGVCCCSGAMAWLFVPETLGLGPEGLLLPPMPTPPSSSSRPAADEEAGGGGGGRLLSSPLDAAPKQQQQQQQGLRRPASAASGERRGGHGQARPPALLEMQAADKGSFSKFKRLPYEGGQREEDEGDDAGRGSDGDDDHDALLLPPPPTTTKPPPLAAAPTPPSSSPSWRNCPYVRHALAGYGLICLHFIALEELVPLWASSPPSAGGLGRKPAQLAGPLALNGAALVVFAAWAYPWLRAKMGTVPLLRAGAALGAGVAALMPLPSLLRPSPFEEAGGSGSKAAAAETASFPLPPLATAVWLALMAVKAAAQAAAFTGAMIRVNVVGKRSGGLGAVNGVGQTLASLARGLGPAAAGLMWAASIGLREEVFGGGRGGGGATQFLPFLAVAGVAVAIWVWYGKKEAEDDG
jgi:MFS family permease